LRDGGLRVEPFHRHFDQATPDTEWLTAIGDRGWVAITHDKNIRYRSLETRALMLAGAPTFVMIGEHPYTALASCFMRVRPKVLRLLNKQDGPFIAKIYTARDDVKLWLTYEQWSTPHGRG